MDIKILMKSLDGKDVEIRKKNSEINGLRNKMVKISSFPQLSSSTPSLINRLNQNSGNIQLPSVFESEME